MAKKKTMDMSFTVKVDPLKFRKFTTSEISRGTGIHKASKGKGSYSRKAKHKGQAHRNDDLSFFVR
ncbi:hypothetical protein PP175_25835 (plasmid) [Aneurinibacillus sp. Ricciae_BoGa-3]|uniref:alternative ribosome rescue factor ArfA n=1 Tax=Aneurinibacillus sp. Ricciae_BoGa-3 TaxID=3022697 RepID=UPI002341A582|nr:alternative ribosome rescue factor ArfA [Aneurinibacillus sp. Ricciae_BoGa-3]WCK57490.1 hypothetical protein PP175_25835 [Aneurinibacillus sp. Ricciae_BoGa-3]